MDDRPYVLLSCAMSVDGHIDDASDSRLLLSNEEDFDRVDAVRASVDAILVGAGTIRADNPRLLVRSQARREARVAAGRPASPHKVTVTTGGDLDPTANFFALGDVPKLVYCPGPAAAKVKARLDGVATVVAAGEQVRLPWVLSDLAERGVTRLMVEGGSEVFTRFLAQGLADELQLVVAPVLVGDDRAPRFVRPDTFSTGRLVVAEVRPLGDVVLIRYRLQS